MLLLLQMTKDTVRTYEFAFFVFAFLQVEVSGSGRCLGKNNLESSISVDIISYYII
jgi:hypothetical protein